MCSITVLIIWFFVVPGNMPVTAKICLEILFNCQLLCLLISILMLPEHISDISQMGKRKTVIQYKAEVPPGAPNWAPLCTCAHWATGTALPFWLKWTGSGGGGSFIESFCLFFYVNFYESTLPSLWAVPGIMLKAIKWEAGAGKSPDDGSWFLSLFSS